MPLRPYTGPNVPLGGCQRMFMFLRPAAHGNSSCTPVATPPLAIDVNVLDPPEDYFPKFVHRGSPFFTIQTINQL
ncbi:Hypothetical protein FKW44_017529 [Caligus rogercresseyi]|uniref:Uncharacterized protein n=1 Tax=Caligus rogercresseyi TaxID=217165 RepID=A0A7T8GT24_CALRO|nr:Hypothetical protein FKW44_017529 [Caligus rogercresseyi]